jgi:hypothetical protein
MRSFFVLKKTKLAIKCRRSGKYFRRWGKLMGKPLITAWILKAGVQFVNAVNPVLDTIVCNIVGAEISKTKADRAIFGVGYENKIAPGINGIRF